MIYGLQIVYGIMPYLSVIKLYQLLDAMDYSKEDTMLLVSELFKYRF